MKKKRAQANIITTILLIVLVLVSIVIVWNVVKALIERSSGQVEIESLTTSLEVKDVKIWVTGGAKVIVKRNPGEGNITALKFNFYKKDGSVETKTLKAEDGYEMPDELETKVYDFEKNELPFNNSDIEKVSLAPMFEKRIGTEIFESEESIKRDEDGERILDAEGLVSWWRFEESGSTLKDYAGNNDGTIHGATWIEDGERGSVLSFDGVDDYVDITNTLPYKGTISLWYYAKPWYNYQTIWDNSVGPNDWEMWIYDNGILIARIGNNLDASYDLDNLDGPNHWYHITVVWNKTSPAICLYVNGVQRECDTSGIWVNPGTNFYLAGGNAGNTKGNGTIDDVMIFNRALTEDEIKALYENQLKE